jgi:hypothetical protein
MQQSDNRIAIHESFSVGALLALAGGFLAAYTYLSRGGVFANAQTGNMVLLGIRLAERNWGGAVRYLIPIIAFAAGVLLAEWIQSALNGRANVRWRQGVLLLEIALLAFIGFVPAAAGTGSSTLRCRSSVRCRWKRSAHARAFVRNNYVHGEPPQRDGVPFSLLSNKKQVLFSNGMKYYAIIVVFHRRRGARRVSHRLDGRARGLVPAGLLIIVFLLRFPRALEQSEPQSRQ